LPEPDDFTLELIAIRLGKSPRWLLQALAEDRRRATPLLQHHHFVGRSPRWDPTEYQALRQAIITLSNAR
jgi:hypothetical protein